MNRLRISQLLIKLADHASDRLRRLVSAGYSEDEAKSVHSKLTSYMRNLNASGKSRNLPDAVYIPLRRGVKAVFTSDPQGNFMLGGKGQTYLGPSMKPYWDTQKLQPAIPGVWTGHKKTELIKAPKLKKKTLFGGLGKRPKKEKLVGPKVRKFRSGSMKYFSKTLGYRPSLIKRMKRLLSSGKKFQLLDGRTLSRLSGMSKGRARRLAKLMFSAMSAGRLAV